MHVHTYQEEALTIQQGRLGYQRSGELPQYAEPGETVVFEPGEAHRFWNAGEEKLLCTGYIQPADNVEYFLTAIYELQRESGGSRSKPFEMAFLMRRYRSEFYMAEIPAVVQRFIFPVQVTVGRLLGKYRKYADAPERSGGEQASEKRTKARSSGRKVLALFRPTRHQRPALRRLGSKYHPGSNPGGVTSQPAIRRAVSTPERGPQTLLPPPRQRASGTGCAP
jgi:Cupin domain